MMSSMPPRSWARWFFDRRDGWERTWPITVELEIGDEWQTFDVEMEHVPSFSANRVEVSDDGLAH